MPPPITAGGMASASSASSIPSSSVPAVTTVSSEKKVLFGKYELDRFLSCGTFAKVYHARISTAKQKSIDVTNRGGAFFFQPWPPLLLLLLNQINPLALLLPPRLRTNFPTASPISSTTEKATAALPSSPATLAVASDPQVAHLPPLSSRVWILLLPSSSLSLLYSSLVVLSLHIPPPLHGRSHYFSCIEGFTCSLDLGVGSGLVVRTPAPFGDGRRCSLSAPSPDLPQQKIWMLHGFPSVGCEMFSSCLFQRRRHCVQSTSIVGFEEN